MEAFVIKQLPFAFWTCLKNNALWYILIKMHFGSAVSRTGSTQAYQVPFLFLLANIFKASKPAGRPPKETMDIWLQKVMSFMLLNKKYNNDIATRKQEDIVHMETFDSNYRLTGNKFMILFSYIRTVSVAKGSWRIWSGTRTFWQWLWVAFQSSQNSSRITLHDIYTSSYRN